MRHSGAIVNAVLMVLLVSVAAHAETALGEWKTAGEKSKVSLVPCGQNKLCGTVVWLKEPGFTDPKEGKLGAPKTDVHNPESSRRNQPVLGLKIMDGFEETGANTWGNGTIYDPESGKTYKCKMKLTSPGRLEVRGYIGISLIGRTEVWNR